MLRHPPITTRFPYTTLFRSPGFLEGVGERKGPGPRDPFLEAEVAVIGEELGPLIRGRVLLHPLLDRSEEHTSELQSRGHLVCRLLLEKKKYDAGTTCTCLCY